MQWLAAFCPQQLPDAIVKPQPAVIRQVRALKRP
jgi:hypothetical protein